MTENKVILLINKSGWFMRRKLIIVLSLILIIVSCASKRTTMKENDLKEIKGNVKSIEEITNQNNPFIEKLNHKLMLFNESNNEIKEISCNSDGTVRAYQLFKYDYKGNRISFEEYNSKDSLLNKQLYLYNDKNNLIKIEWGKDQIWEYSYDENGNKIEWRMIDSKRNINNIQAKYKYDQEGRISSWDEYFNGTYNYTHVLKYDENSNETEENLFDRNGKLYSRYLKYYDAMGNITKYEDFVKDSLIHLTTYDYDKYNNIKKYNFFEPDGKLKSSVIIEYEYDNYGNWIKLVNSTNTVIRKIEYYE